jgi:hypothetical protein
MKDVDVIVHSHMTKRGIPTYGPVTDRLVEYGVAQLRQDFKGKISEPLALVSLVRWFQKQKGFGLENGIRVRLADPDSRGFAFEELMVVYITKKFRHPARLDEVFEFYGTPPAWASQSVQLVHRVGQNNFEPVDLDTQQPVTPGTGVAHYASNVSEVIQWLTESTLGWCLPGILFGPDLMGWMSSNSGDPLLVLFQDKSFLYGNKDSVEAKTAAKALRSLTSSNWFKQAVRPSSSVSCSILIHSSSPLMNVID